MHQLYRYMCYGLTVRVMLSMTWVYKICHCFLILDSPGELCSQTPVEDCPICHPPFENPGYGPACSGILFLGQDVIANVPNELVELDHHSKNCENQFQELSMSVKVNFYSRIHYNLYRHF